MWPTTMIGRIAAVLVVLGLALVGLSAAPVAAQDDSSGGDTPLEIEGDTGFTSLPRPNSGREPVNPSDPGGWQQLVLFTAIVGGLLFIGWRVVMSARRAARARTE